MYSEGFAALFSRGAEWAASGEVTLPPSVSLLPERRKDAVRVLFVTGGHPYDTDMYRVLGGWPDVSWSHATSQAEAFRPDLEKRCDVLVLYDMANEIGEIAQKSLQSYVAAGKGVVALHHSIVDYTSWPWWHEQVIGGKYYEKPLAGHEASHYKDDVPMVCHPVKGRENHPVLRGVGHLVTVDEAYRGMWHSPDVTVLMETDQPLNDKPVVYVGPGENSHAVYIQLGHGPHTMNHPGYRRLVHNAILWAAGRAV
jgi:type 1 glutamine amidotransferase